MLIQLWLRAAWPTGQLNVGRPNVLDPSTFVLAVFAAIAAGIAAAMAFSGDISAAITLADTKDVAAAQNAAAGKGTAPAVASATTVRLRYGLAIVAFGYIAADLGAAGLERIWAGLQLIPSSIQAIWKRLTGSK